MLTYGLLEFTRGAMRASTDSALGQRGKRQLHLIEPGRRGRCEVDVRARMPDQPVLEQRRLVHAVVVYDQMHVQRSGLVGIYAL